MPRGASERHKEPERIRAAGKATAQTETETFATPAHAGQRRPLRVRLHLGRSPKRHLSTADDLACAPVKCQDFALLPRSPSYQRRGRDSNPRWTVRPTTVFEPVPFSLESQS
jgi:hypothetical protein